MIDAGRIIAEGTADELKRLVGGDVFDLQLEDRADARRRGGGDGPGVRPRRARPHVDPELGTVVVPVERRDAPALTQALRALDAEHVPIVD